MKTNYLKNTKLHFKNIKLKLSYFQKKNQQRLRYLQILQRQLSPFHFFYACFERTDGGGNFGIIWQGIP